MTAMEDEEPGIPQDLPVEDGNETIGVVPTGGPVEEGDPPPPPPDPEPEPGPPDENYPPVDQPG